MEGKAGDRQEQEQEEQEQVVGDGWWLVGADTKTLQERWDTDIVCLL